MSKHTPGPWVIGNPAEIHAPDGTRIVACCQTHDDAREDQSETNARLISAAPELLESAQEMADLLDNLLRIGAINPDLIIAESIRNVLPIHRAAIAKATGEKP